jgi:glycine oxidase
LPVRPVKGQILRLRDPAGPGLLQRAVRFDGGYMVPRADGRYVLGATVEERGFAAQPSVGGVYELLRHTNEVLPGISELEIEELSVGFRPGTPDNAPAVGPSGVPGLTWATGHYRNGVLLAPLTAEMVVAVLEGADPSAPAAPEHGPVHAPAQGEEELSLSALLSICAPTRFMSDPDSPARASSAPVGAVP